MYETYCAQLQQVYIRLKAAEKNVADVTSQLVQERLMLSTQHRLVSRTTMDAQKERWQFLTVVKHLCATVGAKRLLLHKSLIRTHDQLAVIRDYVLGPGGAGSDSLTPQERAEHKENAQRYATRLETLRYREPIGPRPKATDLVRLMSETLDELRPALARFHTRLE